MTEKLIPARHLRNLPPYLFSRINALKLRAYEKKLDVIDLAMGNPDIATPRYIVDRLIDTVANHPRTHRYPQAKGMPRLRRSIAQWMANRFSVQLDPEKEILVLIGSKEGIAHLCMSYLNRGDIALVCSPAYPVHFNGVYLAGGRVYSVPLKPENKYLPDIEKIPKNICRRAKMFFLNYPNNPTTAVIDDLTFLEKVVWWAKKYQILVVYDNAYSEITFDGYVAPSFLEIPGAKDIGLEFHSFSKTFNMAGWRLGWVAGSEKLLSPLEKFKSYLDYGVPTFIQLAGAFALESSSDHIKEQTEIYRRRRDIMVTGLNKIGWPATSPRATMYLWLKLPEKFQAQGSMKFSEKLLEDTGIAISPGVGFGPEGEGYIRMALVTHDRRFHDALLRLKKFIK